MPTEFKSRDTLMRLDISREDILNLDPLLFDDEEKQKMITALYGDNKSDWQQSLQEAAFGVKRWQGLLSTAPKQGTPYKITYEFLIKKAKVLPPNVRKNTVTSFTDWLYRLYMTERDLDKLQRGRATEKEIQKKRLSLTPHAKWKVIYNGMDGCNSAPLTISSLLIDCNPVRGMPDIVLREKGTKRFIIIEIKLTDADLPLDGWPNLRAQLWAYSKCDLLTDAEEILLIGEVWGLSGGLHRRRVYQWDSDDPTLNVQNSSLFNMYAGNTTVPRKPIDLVDKTE